MSINLSTLFRNGNNTNPLIVALGGTGLTTITANSVLLGNGTLAPTVVAPGTSGNILTSNGTTWTSAPSSAPSSAAASSRATVSNTTISIAAAATANLTIVGYKGYALYKVQTASSSGTGGAWVRIYTNVASRTADANRLQTSDPAIQGIIAEVITTANTTVSTTPGVIGFNDESTPTSNIELAVTNTSQVASAITITLTLLQLEV